MERYGDSKGDIYLRPMTEQDTDLIVAWRNSEEVRKHFTNKVYQTLIPRNVRLSEAPSYGLPIILYDKNSKGAEAYLQLADELIKVQ